jgi:hypothetical protein
VTGKEAMRAFQYALIRDIRSQPPADVEKAMRGLKVGKAPCLNGIGNRALKRLAKRAIFI